MARRVKPAVEIDDMFEAAATAEAAKTLALRSTGLLEVRRSTTVSAKADKKSREPTRYSAPLIDTGAQALPAYFGVPAVLDTRGHTRSARAVLDAKASTCRFVFGEGRDDFRYCGKPATVAAAGRLAYCADCAKRMYQPTAKSAAHRPLAPSLSDRHFKGA